MVLNVRDIGDGVAALDEQGAAVAIRDLLRSGIREEGGEFREVWGDEREAREERAWGEKGGV